MAEFVEKNLLHLAPLLPLWLLLPGRLVYLLHAPRAARTELVVDLRVGGPGAVEGGRVLVHEVRVLCAAGTPEVLHLHHLIKRKKKFR